MKAFLVPGMLFEELGFAYIGVVDGHDMHALRAEHPPGHRHAPAGGRARQDDQGQGLRAGRGPAGRVPRHRAVPHRQRREQVARRSGTTYTQAFGEALVRLAERDERIVAITAAMTQGTGLEAFERRFPDRFYDVGIAEEHAVVFAAGLALGGMRPVVGVYSTFLQRAFDMLDAGRRPAAPAGGVRRRPGRPRRRRRPDAPRRLRPLLPARDPQHGGHGAVEPGGAAAHAATALTLDGPVAMRYPRGLAAPFAPLEELEPVAVGTRRRAAGGRRGRARRHRHRRRHRARGGRSCWPPRACTPTVVDARFVKPLDTELLQRLAATHTAPRDDRGEHARRRLRQRRAEAVGAPVRSCASGCPTRSCRTATARACSRTSASRRRPSPGSSCPEPGAGARQVGPRARAARRAARRPRPLRHPRPGAGRRPRRRGDRRRADGRQAGDPGGRRSRAGGRRAHALRLARRRQARHGDRAPRRRRGRRGRHRPGQLHRRASSTGCCRAGPPAWSPSTSATGSSTGGCATTRA